MLVKQLIWHKVSRFSEETLKMAKAFVEVETWQLSRGLNILEENLKADAGQATKIRSQLLFHCCRTICWLDGVF